MSAAIEQFTSITGADPQTARWYLDAAQGNVEVAVSTFLEAPPEGEEVQQNSDDEAVQALSRPTAVAESITYNRRRRGASPIDLSDDGATAASNSNGRSTRSTKSQLPANGKRTASTAFDTSKRPAAAVARRNHADSPPPLAADDPSMYSPPAPKAAVHDTLVGGYEPIPMPMMTRHQAAVHDPFRDFVAEGLLNGAAHNGRGARPAAAKPHVGGEWSQSSRLSAMFKPPAWEYSIRTRTAPDFDAAVAAAESSGKWLIVNVQESETFQSHALNRDLWNDQQTARYTQQSCILLQLQHGSAGAQQFERYYNVHKFPYIGIIDPRTRQKVAQHELYVSIGNPNPKATQKHYLTWLEQFIRVNGVPDDSTASKHKGSRNNTNDQTDGADELIDLTRQSTSGASSGAVRSTVDLTDDERMQLAIRESLQDESSASSVDNEQHATTNAPDVVDLAESPVQEPVKVNAPRRQLVIPPEPPAGATDATRLQLRFPSTTRLQRRFNKQDTVQMLYDFALDHLQTADPSLLETPVTLRLVTSQPRRQVHDDMLKTLEADGLLNTQVLVEVD